MTFSQHVFVGLWVVLLLRFLLLLLLNHQRRFLRGIGRPPREVKEGRRHCARKGTGKRRQRHRRKRQLWGVSDHAKRLTQSGVERSSSTRLTRRVGAVRQTCAGAVAVNIVITFVLAVAIVAGLSGHSHNIVKHRIQLGGWRC